jgi:hypothetical protein
MLIRPRIPVHTQNESVTILICQNVTIIFTIKMTITLLLNNNRAILNLKTQEVDS